MIELAFANDLGRWLLTYLVHSTILLVSAWLLTRKTRRHAETLWTAALLGGILTASLQVGLGYGSILGTVALPQSAVAIETPANLAEALRQPRQVRTRETSRPPLPLLSAEPIPASPIASPQNRLARSWGTFLAGFWLLGATLMAARLAVQALRFRHRLTDRTEVKSPSLLERLSWLVGKGRERSVRLTSSSRARVPFACGWIRPEICLPNRVLTELDDETQEVILAHELAHIERRDPLWQLVHQLVAAVFFVQPLNWIACREIREQAELSCDRRAAELTGRPVALARVLTEIATWFQPHSLRAVPGVVSGAGGNLSRRVSRLLEPEHNTRKVWHGLALAGVLLVAVATLAPAFSAQAEVPSPPPAAAPPVPVVTLAPAPPTPAAAPLATPTQLTVPKFTVVTAIPEPPMVPIEIAAVAPVAVALPIPPAPVVKASPAPLQEQSEAVQEADADDSADDSEEHEAEIEAIEEEIEAAMEELEAVFEGFEETFEEEIEAAMEELEAVLEAEMEGLEEQIEEQMEGIEEEIEALAEELEERMEAAAEELETTQDEARRRELEAEIGAAGRELGQLGAMIGETFAQANLGSQISAITVPFAQIAAQMAVQQAEIAKLIATHMTAFYGDGHAPSEEELASLRAEMEHLRVEMAPQREEIARLQEELRGQLGPLREEMQAIGDQVREDLKRWAEEH